MKRFLVGIMSLTMALALGMNSFAMPASVDTDKEYSLGDSALKIITVFSDELPENFIPETIGPDDPRYAEATPVIVDPLSLSSQGGFSFDFRNSAMSEKFKLAGSSSKISSTATTARSNKNYTISLYEGSGTSYTLKKSVKYVADGKLWAYNFTGLSTSKVYYLYFSASDSNNQIYARGGVSNFAQLYQ